jgi:hypothetical protein
MTDLDYRTGQIDPVADEEAELEEFEWAIAYLDKMVAQLAIVNAEYRAERYPELFINYVPWGIFRGYQFNYPQVSARTKVVEMERRPGQTEIEYLLPQKIPLIGDLGPVAEIFSARSEIAKWAYGRFVVFFAYASELDTVFSFI